MLRFIQIAVAALLVAVVVQPSQAKKAARKPEPTIYSPPGRADLPADLQRYVQTPLRSSAAMTDTIQLGWWDFDGPSGADPQGWTGLDLTEQEEGVMFHVADDAQMAPVHDMFVLEGTQSMWCGAPESTLPAICHYARAGYGNDWRQYLNSDTLACDSVRVYYKVAFASEPGGDFSYFEHAENGAWTALPVNNGFGFYDGNGGEEVECFAFAVPSGQTALRFRFYSDGAWSAEDGLAYLQGAIVVDSITVQCFNNGTLTDTYFEDFESAPVNATQVGIWTGAFQPGFGDFAALYPGVNVLQDRDACVFNRTYLWGFFDDPANASYSCDRNLPDVGALPIGPDENGLYLNNVVASPLIPMVGSGDKILLTYDDYRDNPLDALQFSVWKVRSWVDGCPTSWRDANYVYFGVKGWSSVTHDVSIYLEPNASHIQVALGAYDACDIWCGIFGFGICDVHAPLYDNVRVVRVNQIGPEIIVNHVDLFQDNFSEDGTVTGPARADMARDILPSTNPSILPGDSICATMYGLGTDPNSGVGPAAYVYVAVWPYLNPAGKTPAAIEAPETRPGAGGKRYPLVGTVMHDGVTWACFRMDSAFTDFGALVNDRYCFDLNDNVFTPGDTVCYVLAADDGAGNTNYWSRRLNGQGADFVTDDLAEALTSPLEFTILPSGQFVNTLYVDAADDRAGPVQLFFDSSFDILGIRKRIDRYDILGPSSVVNNGLASRVKDFTQQIDYEYGGIIWSSGDLSVGTIGDGTGSPSKSDDFGLLWEFLDVKPNLPGIYMSGDNIAEEWVNLTGVWAVNLRAIYMNFDLVDGNHVSAGEALSPVLTPVGPCFISLGVPNEIMIYGGCPQIRDFDVLQTTSQSVSEFPYPGGSGDAMISQTTPNSGGSTACILLSGFSYDSIRDTEPGFPPSRVTHMRNAFICCDGLIGPLGPPIGIPDGTSREFLSQASPNPFNPTTTIRFGIRERGHVSLKVYNVAGQLVRTLVNDVKTPRAEGFEVTWDGRSERGDAVASGVYFYKLTSKGFAQTKKMVLLK